MLETLIVLVLDDLFELSELITDGCKLFGRWVLGVLHADGQSSRRITGMENLGKEVVGGLGCFGRSVVEVQREEQATLLVDFDASFATLYLFGQLIEADVLVVEIDFDKTIGIRKWKSCVASHVEGNRIHLSRWVAIVGQQHVFLALRYAQQTGILAQLDLIGLLVVPKPGGIASPSDGVGLHLARLIGRRLGSRIILVDALSLNLDLAGNVIVATVDGRTILCRDVHYCAECTCRGGGVGGL